MTDAANRFYNSIENAADQSQTSLVELFVYFLTVEAGQETATPKQVNDCFVACDLAPPKNVAARLAEGLKTRPPKYIKANGGYKLQRHKREALSEKLGAEKVIAQTSCDLSVGCSFAPDARVYQGYPNRKLWREPNEHSQECPIDAERSRDSGASHC